MTAWQLFGYRERMTLLQKPLGLAGLLAVVLMGGWVSAVFAEELPSAAGAIGGELVASEVLEDEWISMPTPGELFTALRKQAQPVWSVYFREPIPTSYTNRVQLALALGTLVADGFVAVEAMDSQQVKNIGKDILALAKGLGVSDELVARGNAIADFAENNEWAALNEELEATQNELQQQMMRMRDDDLVILVAIGGWLRGTEVVSGIILDDYTPEAARVLRQPELVRFLRGRLDGLSERHRQEALVQLVREQLLEMEALLETPLQSEISEATVETVRDAAGRATQGIAKRE